MPPGDCEPCLTSVLSGSSHLRFAQTLLLPELRSRYAINIPANTADDHADFCLKWLSHQRSSSAILRY
jgi:hypothetical protein